MNEYFYAYKIIGDVETTGSAIVIAETGMTAYKMAKELLEKQNKTRQVLITALNEI